MTPEHNSMQVHGHTQHINRPSTMNFNFTTHDELVLRPDKYHNENHNPIYWCNQFKLKPRLYEAFESDLGLQNILNPGFSRDIS